MGMSVQEVKDGLKEAATAMTKGREGIEAYLGNPRDPKREAFYKEVLRISQSDFNQAPLRGVYDNEVVAGNVFLAALDGKKPNGPYGGMANNFRGQYIGMSSDEKLAFENKIVGFSILMDNLPKVNAPQQEAEVGRTEPAVVLRDDPGHPAHWSHLREPERLPAHDILDRNLGPGSIVGDRGLPPGVTERPPLLRGTDPHPPWDRNGGKVTVDPGAGVHDHHFGPRPDVRGGGDPVANLDLQRPLPAHGQRGPTLTPEEQALLREMRGAIEVRRVVDLFRGNAEAVTDRPLVGLSPDRLPAFSRNTTGPEMA